MRPMIAFASAWLLLAGPSFAADPPPAGDDAPEKKQEEAAGAGAAPAQETAPPRAKAPAKKPAAPAPAPRDPRRPPAPGAPKPTAAPLRFTDDDLADRFHKPSSDRHPAEGEEEGAEIEIEAGEDASAAPAPSGATPPRPKAPRAVPGVVAPKAPAAAPTAAPSHPVSRGALPPNLRAPLGSAPAASPGAVPGAPDPLKPYRDREAKEKFRARQVEDLRAKITALEARIEHLNARKLALVNPYHPMPEARSDEEKRQNEEMKAADLHKQVEEKIRAAEAELAATRETLLDIQLRFGSEPDR